MHVLMCCICHHHYPHARAHTHMYAHPHMCTKCPLPPGLLCHTLLLPGRVPGKILIAKDSGRLLQLELLTLYNERGLVERIEVVPYRLTRNLQVFLSSFGVEVCRLADRSREEAREKKAQGSGGGVEWE